MTDILEYKFCIGLILRRQFRSYLKNLKFNFPSADIQVDEDKRFLESMFYITIHGSDEIRQRVEDQLDAMIKHMGER